MRTTLTAFGLAALTLAAPVAAASGLRGIMHSWKADARATNDMLAGRAGFDESAIRAALQTYVADAGQIAAQVNGKSAEARGLRAAFLQFQADAKAALGDVARPAALKGAFSRVAADCQSCHDAYTD